MAEQLGRFGEIDSSETLFSLQYFVTICLPIPSLYCGTGS